MRKATPLKAGEVFGLWTVLGLPSRRGQSLYAPVSCQCGNVKLVEQSTLRRGLSKSCGCLNAVLVSTRCLTHGKRDSPVYAVWNVMIQRCGNKKNRQYPDYGGRGIAVCEDWRKFVNFYKDMGDPPFPSATLDRIDNDSGYCKTNCRWVNRATNNRNRRNSLKFTYLGEERSLQEISLLCGVTYGTLYQRLHSYKWPFSKAVQVQPK